MRKGAIKREDGGSESVAGRVKTIKKRVGKDELRAGGKKNEGRVKETEGSNTMD